MISQIPLQLKQAEYRFKKGLEDIELSKQITGLRNYINEKIPEEKTKEL